MPTTPPPSRAVRVSRRTAVGGAAALGALVVGGCTPRGIDARPAPEPAGRRTRAPHTDADPDVALAATVLAAEQALLDRVLATVRRHPRLEATLTSARAAHTAHVDLLTAAVPPAAARTPTPSATAGPGPATVPVPARSTAALTALVHEEDQLSLLGRRSSFDARSGAFARVLASMAAASAQQARALTQAAGGTR